MPTTRLLSVLAAWLLLPEVAPAASVRGPWQEQAGNPDVPPLFASHEPLEFVLEADFRTIRREDRKDGAPERPARIRYQADGDSATIDLQVRTRGNFRLSRSNCSFPPLRLNFGERDLAGTVFDGQEKLKLVVPCRHQDDRHEQYLLSEYLAYRIYGILSDYSFRVRLARITFADTSGGEDPFTRYSFIIESEEALAERLSGVVLELPPHVRVDPSFIEPEHASLTALFQFLIGNTDWSILALHNEVLIRDDLGRHFAIAYDFDFSGLVDARYAVPDTALPIQTVRARLYRGYCWDAAADPRLFERFREARGAVENLIEDTDGLSDERRRDTLEYVESFYEQIADPDRAEQWIRGACIGLRP